MTARLAIQAVCEQGESEPMSVVLIDCDDMREAQVTATFIRSFQSGEATLKVLGEHVTFGDNALKLSFPLAAQTPERIRVVLSARRKPTDVTEAIYMETEVDRKSAEVFRYFHMRRHTYALMVSVAGVPQTDLLYLVKYMADYPWRPRLKHNDLPPGNDMKDVMKLAGLPGWDQSSL